MDTKIKRRIYLSGRVQGVGCRAYIKKNAKILNLHGWVKNLDDGRVEAVFSGKQEKVQEMLRLASKGPSLGKISNMKVVDEEYREEFDDFVIRY